MSTYMPKKGDITRNWYVLDAAGKPLGKVAAEAATLLRGKHKPTFTSNADCGDQKMYYHQIGYIGNLKEIKYSTIMKTKPEFAVTKAVKGMIPDSVIGRQALTRLRVYAGAEHKHAAQKPEVREF